MFSPIQVISTAMAVASAQSAGIVVAHITTIQKPFLSVRRYATGLFGALLCFSFSFASAGCILSVSLLTLDLAMIIAIISAMIFPPIFLQQVIQQAKREKAETTQRIQQKPRKRFDKRRYFYT